VHPAFLSVLDAMEIAGLVADAVEALSESGKKVFTTTAISTKTTFLKFPAL
jgi:hypothetical protein